MNTTVNDGMQKMGFSEYRVTIFVSQYSRKEIIVWAKSHEHAMQIGDGYGMATSAVRSSEVKS